MHHGVATMANSTADVQALECLFRLFVTEVDKGIDVFDNLLGHAFFCILELG
jgi:hypothetical protein